MLQFAGLLDMTIKSRSPPVTPSVAAENSEREAARRVRNTTPLGTALFGQSKAEKEGTSLCRADTSPTPLVQLVPVLHTGEAVWVGALRSHCHLSNNRCSLPMTEHSGKH